MTDGIEHRVTAFDTEAIKAGSCSCCSDQIIPEPPYTTGNVRVFRFRSGQEIRLCWRCRDEMKRRLR